MTQTRNWPFEKCRTRSWKHALLSVAIAIAPALALAGDKDKDKDKDKSNKRTQAAGATPMGSTATPRQTFNVPQDNRQQDLRQQDNRQRNGQETKLNSRELNITNAPSQLPSQLGITTPLTSKGRSDKNEGERNRTNSRAGDDSNQKILKSADTKGNNQQPEITGRNAIRSGDSRLNKDELKLNRDGSKLSKDDLKLNRDGLKSNKDESKLSRDDLKLNRDSLRPNKDESKLSRDDLKLNRDSLKLNRNESKLSKDDLKLNRDSLKPNKDESKLSSDDLKLNRDSLKLNKDESKLSKDDLKLNKDSLKSHKDDFKLSKGDINHDAKKANFLDLHKAGKFDGLIKGSVAKKLELGKQLELKHKGDLTLNLNLAQKMKLHGGWAKTHWAGLIAPGFGYGCSPIVYCGPGYFPSHCLWPGWNPWVEFCWGFRCDPICDPRPWFCRPWIYDPCSVWVWWDYPVWYELPVVTCGTWVDVEPIVVEDGLDLRLLAVRFVDPGQPELLEGPRFRVWALNNSARTRIENFNILLMASNSREAALGLPQAGVRVDSMAPGEIKAFDIRLPFEATAMGRDLEGRPLPFSYLHAIVDSHREIPEVFEENNGAVIARGDILPVDPVIFGTDSPAAPPGTEINIAGEGFGPEPGQVLVHVGGIELQAEIEGWYDLGVRVKLPELALASPTDAELVVIRGDTAASNPLTIQLAMPIASR